MINIHKYQPRRDEISGKWYIYNTEHPIIEYGYTFRTKKDCKRAIAEWFYHTTYDDYVAYAKSH